MRTRREQAGTALTAGLFLALLLTAASAEEPAGPDVLLRASVNPESRVKIEAARHRVRLRDGVPRRFWVDVRNAAGVTAPLSVRAVDLSFSPPRPAAWCRVRVVDSAESPADLSGASEERKLLEVRATGVGLREVRLVADVGQGTQDLGFRATADLMIDTAPAETARTKDVR